MRTFGGINVKNSMHYEQVYCAEPRRTQSDGLFIVHRARDHRGWLTSWEKDGLIVMGGGERAYNNVNSQGQGHRLLCGCSESVGRLRSGPRLFHIRFTHCCPVPQYRLECAPACLIHAHLRRASRLCARG
jgi:hypothetical protein